MRRIQVVLVLLMAVLLVSATGLAPRAYADDGSALAAPISLHNVGGADVVTSAAPPGGDDAEGDPDSMGDGLSRQIGDSGAVTSDAGSGPGSRDIWAISESLLYLLAQIQLLIP